MSFLKSIFTDVDGQGSSKRLATFAILGLITTIAIGSTFSKTASFNERIWDDLIWTFWICMGFITSEKFTTRSAPPKSQP